MTASLLQHASGRSLQPIFDRLQRVHFPATRFTEPQADTVAAQFFQSRLTSAFQPIVRAADGAIAGHQALLRVFADGAHVAPWSLFAQASSDAMLLQLDRLTRAVHALNYFPQAKTDTLLFLNVDARLLAIVTEDHGAYFELILAEIGAAAKRVAVVLPPAALDDPVSFVRAAIAYRMRGYRVVAQLCNAVADPEPLFLADPHFVAMDAPGARDAHAEIARDIGFDFLQGRHFEAFPHPIPRNRAHEPHR
jgi:EAL domain-containing protein (putative c-di-GMP-specific phosphodiesterase class I)